MEEHFLILVPTSFTVKEAKADPKLHRDDAVMLNWTDDVT